MKPTASYLTNRLPEASIDAVSLRTERAGVAARGRVESGTAPKTRGGWPMMRRVAAIVFDERRRLAGDGGPSGGAGGTSAIACASHTVGCARPERHLDGFDAHAARTAEGVHREGRARAGGGRRPRGARPRSATRVNRKPGREIPAPTIRSGSIRRRRSSRTGARRSSSIRLTADCRSRPRDARSRSAIRAITAPGRATTRRTSTPASAA